MGFNNLPDLVITGILKNAMIDLELIDGIKIFLPFLAINQRWRALALPIAYRYVFIEENGFLAEQLMSNIGLVMDGRYTRKLSISIYTGNTKLIDILKTLLAQINTGRPVTAWPKENNSNNFIQGDEIANVTSDYLQDFAVEFPNISELHIKIAADRNIDQNFASQLISTYAGQLTELSCNVNTPLMITHFPKRLVKLDYSYPNWGTPSIPIINPYPLKELFLNYSPDTWSWQQYCESPVFSNLEFLSISTSPNNELEPMDKVTTMRVDLSNLKRLFISDSNMDISYTLKFGNISQHLDRIVIDGNFGILDEISKLNIKSIGWLKVKLGDNEDQDMAEFYKATNQLFSNHTNISLSLSEDLDIDYKQTKWENVKELRLSSDCFNGVIKALTHLPNLKTFAAYRIYYDDMDKSLLEPLKHSKVEDFDVHAFFTIDGHELEELENQSEIIRKHLPMLRKSK